MASTSKKKTTSKKPVGKKILAKINMPPERLEVTDALKIEALTRKLEILESRMNLAVKDRTDGLVAGSRSSKSPIVRFRFTHPRLRYAPRPDEKDLLASHSTEMRDEAEIEMIGDGEGNEELILPRWMVRFCPKDGVDLRIQAEHEGESWIPTGLSLLAPEGDSLVVARKLGGLLPKGLMVPIAMIVGGVPVELVVPVRNLSRTTLVLHPGEEIASISLASGRPFKIAAYRSPASTSQSAPESESTNPQMKRTPGSPSIGAQLAPPPGAPRPARARSLAPSELSDPLTPEDLEQRARGLVPPPGITRVGGSGIGSGLRPMKPGELGD